MIYALLQRPGIDKGLATAISYWLRRHAKQDLYGQTDVEFYIWEDHREVADA